MSEVDHYAAFVKLCRTRIDQLGITLETVDEICCFPARYTSKILTGKPACSVYSLFTLARGLALMPVFQHDEAQLIRNRARLDWIARKRQDKRLTRRKRRLNPSSTTIKLYPDFMKKIAILSVEKRMQMLARKKRISEVRRKAAMARWSNV